MAAVIMKWPWIGSRRCIMACGAGRSAEAAKSSALRVKVACMAKPQAPSVQKWERAGRSAPCGVSTAVILLWEVTAVTEGGYHFFY